MKRSLFRYDLPSTLIANYPAKERTASRLLVLDGLSGRVEHSEFKALLDQIKSGDLLVFNNTKVIPARVFGRKSTGGKVELLVERVLDSQCFLAHIKSSKSPKPGSLLQLGDTELIDVIMTSRRGDLFEVALVDESQNVIDVLDRIGHMPLPPYIDRADESLDQDRYQTVYGNCKGAVAAPTAGLHFDAEMMDAIEAKGAEIAYVTLHVGAGTFQPVRADDILDHHMHSEFVRVEQSVCDQVKRVQKNGGRIIAVGTTSVRCLETASAEGEMMPYEGDTDIFIYPGYQFKTVDALLTNFHLSESTLIMLVSAFAGYSHIMAAYKEAIAEKYRFFSYGDAMFMTRNPDCSSQIDEEN